MSFCEVMSIFFNYLCLMYLLFVFPMSLIEATPFTQFIIQSQGQILASIIIVSDSSLPSWVYVLSIFLRDNKTMCIQIYLPIIHYINLFGLSRCTQVTWHTLQHHKCGMSTSFLHSLQCTNLVLFNGSLSLFKYIHQLLNS